MADENVKNLIAQGLSAMKAGGEVAKQATDEIGNDATHPALKAALDQGNDTSKLWTERLARAEQQAGGGDQNDNQILEAHYRVSKMIRAEATDETSRDLGIVAAGQLALHYWIGSFGTMANYAKACGMDDVARDMKTCADEAKQADEAHTRIAEQLLAA